MHKETKYCTLLQFIHLILIDLFCNRGVFMQSSPWWRGPNPEVGEKREPNFAWIIIILAWNDHGRFHVLYYLLFIQSSSGESKREIVEGERVWWGGVGGGCRRETEKDGGGGGGCEKKDWKKKECNCVAPGTEKASLHQMWGHSSNYTNNTP